MTNRPHSRNKKVSNTTVKVKKKPISNSSKKTISIKNIVDLFKK